MVDPVQVDQAVLDAQILELAEVRMAAAVTTNRTVTVGKRPVRIARTLS